MWFVDQTTMFNLLTLFIGHHLNQQLFIAKSIMDIEFSKMFVPNGLHPECIFKQIVQYQCRMENKEIICYPVVRYFRKCPDQPLVEVTPEYSNAGKPISSLIDPENISLSASNRKSFTFS
jgi:hypothetical protein